MFKLLGRLFKKKSLDDTIEDNLLLRSRERLEITKAIMNVLSKEEKELHHKEIYGKIRHNNYNHKKFISVIYYLVNKRPGQIKYGKNKGCFAINRPE
jgi:predicted transcriptional regulator